MKRTDFRIRFLQDHMPYERGQVIDCEHSSGMADALVYYGKAEWVYPNGEEPKEEAVATSPKRKK